MDVKKQKRSSFFVATTACLSGFLYGYYMAIISGALGSISSAFHLTLGKESLFVSILLLGALGGSLLGGPLTRALGRKKVFWLTCLCLMLGCFCLLIATSYPVLIVGRIIQGIGIGGISVVAPLYLGEIAHPAHRGRIVAAYQLLINTGILFAYLVNAMFLSSGNWQGMMLIGLIPALLQVCFLFFIPESPLWLFKKKQYESASEVSKELDLPAFQEKTDVQAQEIPVSRKVLKGIWIVGLLLSAFQQITGINTVIYYAPRIFAHAGYSSEFQQMMATVVLGATNLVACWIALKLLDRLGRKKLLLIGIAGMMVSLLCLAGLSVGSFSFTGHLSVLLLMVYVFGFSIGLGPVTWVLLAEIYPSQLREKAMSVALFINWLCVFFVLWTFPFMLSSVKILGSFGLYGVLCGVAFLFVLKMLPETKQKDFSEILKIFQDKFK